MSDTEKPHDDTLDDETTQRGPTTRGLIDGSLNNANVLNAANIVGLMSNSQISDDSNNNANTRAHGKKNNAVND